MYLSYIEYQMKGGTLDRAVFDRCLFKAEGKVNKYTLNRLVNETDVPEAVKDVLFELICIFADQSKAMNSDGVVVSRSNDGVYESYRVMSAVDAYKNLDSQIGDVILQGLSGVCNSKGKRLLYRGFYPDE